MTDELFEPGEIVIETGMSGDDDDVFNGFGSGPTPIETRGEGLDSPPMPRYRLRRNISDATIEAIQDYLTTFGSGRAGIDTIDGTVFLQPLTQSDVDLLCSEMGRSVTGWKVEQ